MMLLCTNRHCGTEDNHLLDTTDNQVHCLECGGTLNVPSSTKTTLKTLGQVKRTSQKGLTFKCKSCGVKDRPILKTLANHATIGLCKACGKEMDNIPGPFIEALKVVGPEDVPESTND